MFSLHTAFDVLWNVLLVLIALVYPFVAVLRGGRFIRTVCIAWCAMVLYVGFLSLGLPAVVAMFSGDAGRTLELHWVPEGPFVFAIALLGWVYPIVASLFAIFARRLFG